MEFVRYLDSKVILFTASMMGTNMPFGKASKMQQLGCRKGFPDILIFEPRNHWMGLAIEMKRRNFKYYGRSEHLRLQAITLKALADRCWFSTFASGAEDAIAITDWYLNL